MKGLEAIEVVGQRRNPDGATLSSSIILLPHNDDLFVIYGAGSDEVYKKILSTFTFLDQNTTEGRKIETDGPCKGLYRIEGTDLCTHGPDPGVGINENVPPVKPTSYQ